MGKGPLLSTRQGNHQVSAIEGTFHTSSKLGYDILLLVLAYKWHCEKMIIVQVVAEEEYICEHVQFNHHLELSDYFFHTLLIDINHEAVNYHDNTLKRFQVASKCDEVGCW